MKRRVARLMAPRRFEIHEEELPPLGEEEMLVRIVSSGLCHTELPTFQGRSTMKMREDGSFFKETDLEYPITFLGHEPVGVVEDVGPRVTRYAVGDMVSGPERPGFASHIVRDTRTCRLAKIPPTADNPERCLAEPLACCSNIVRAANPELGDYTAIIGCGMMGLLCLSAISHSSAFETIAIDLIDSRLELARELGATLILNPNRVDVEEEVRRATGGHGVDVAIEITGRMAGFSLAGRILRGGGPVTSAGGRGKIIMASLYEKPEPMDIGYELMFKAPTMLSTHPWYSMNYMDDLRRGVGGYLKGLFPIDRLITHEFGLEAINEAFCAMEKSEEGFIKGIILP